MAISGVGFEKIQDIKMPEMPGISDTGKSTGSTSFKDVLGNFVDDVNELQINADDSIKKLASGEIKDPHQVFLKMNEANLAFDFMMQMRNKLLEAYKKVLSLG